MTSPLVPMPQAIARELPARAEGQTSGPVPGQAYQPAEGERLADILGTAYGLNQQTAASVARDLNDAFPVSSDTPLKLPATLRELLSLGRGQRSEPRDRVERREAHSLSPQARVATHQAVDAPTEGLSATRVNPNAVEVRSPQQRPPTLEEQVLELRIEHKLAEMELDSSQLPPLRVGQGIIDERQGRVEFRVTEVSEDGITLESLWDNIPSRTVTRDELASQLNNAETGWVLHSEPSLASERVPTIAESLFEDVIAIDGELATLRLQNDLGPKQFEIVSALMQRRSHLVGERASSVTELRQWLDEHDGFTSMSRLGVATFRAMSLRQFGQMVNDPELLQSAPQRGAVLRADQAIEEIDAAVSLVLDGVQLSEELLDVSKDPVLAAQVRFAQSDSDRMAPRDLVETRLASLQSAAADGRVGDGWAAYDGVVQPYLHLKGSDGDSFHHTANGEPSLTLAVNQLIRAGRLGDRNLVTSADDLEAMADELRANWRHIYKEHEVLRVGSVVTFDGWQPPSEFPLEAEIARLRALEATTGHQDLRTAMQPAALRDLVAELVDAEPTFSERFGTGVLKVLDSPETWAMVAVGTLTAGAASGAALGTAAVSTAQIVNLVRTGALTWRAAGMFAASSAIDGAAFHTGMNLFNIGRGEAQRADWGPVAYARSVALMGATQTASARHALRAARMSPGIMRHAGEAGRHFAEEVGAMSLVGVVESFMRSGNLDGTAELLEHNAQFLVAMRMANGLKGVSLREANNRQRSFEETHGRYRQEPTEANLQRSVQAFEKWASHVQRSVGNGEKSTSQRHDVAAQLSTTLLTRQGLVSPAEAAQLTPAQLTSLAHLSSAVSRGSREVEFAMAATQTHLGRHPAYDRAVATVRGGVDGGRQALGRRLEAAAATTERVPLPGGGEVMLRYSGASRRSSENSEAAPMLELASVTVRGNGREFDVLSLLPPGFKAYHGPNGAINFGERYVRFGRSGDPVKDLLVLMHETGHARDFIANPGAFRDYQDTAYSLGLRTRPEKGASESFLSREKVAWDFAFENLHRVPLPEGTRTQLRAQAEAGVRTYYDKVREVLGQHRPLENRAVRRNFEAWVASMPS